MKVCCYPKPKNLDDITVPNERNNLAEVIAENVYDVWAQGRISSSWTYGPVRNDEKKQTPCLVPYDELTEEEKEYGRNTAFETLKLIISLGYDIVKTEKSRN